MKIFLRSSLLFSLLICLSCSSEKDQYLEINGRVVNSETASIILVKPNQDIRFDSIIEIPVVNGEFYYRSKLENPEAVTLLLGEAKNSGGRFMPLFLENEKIDLTIYSEDEFDKNVVEGGTLNAEYRQYKEELALRFDSRLQPLKDSINNLFTLDEYNSDENKVLLLKLRQAETLEEQSLIRGEMEILRKLGRDKSSRAKALSDRRIEVDNEMEIFKQNYIEENPNLISYSFLLNDLIYSRESLDIALAKKNYQNLSNANPDHPYNQLASNLINALENINVGKKYIDFSAPTLEGESIKLSEQINGKVALLNLWATWCGPCIGKSRTMVPLYNEYKDKGFTILGVAGEFKNTDRLVTFLDEEKWPWLNLVELDRENAIWTMYGVDGAGGAIFLIDETGKILAVNPTAEEVRNELEARLI